MEQSATPSMASAGAVILRSLPWSGDVVDPMEVARKVWRAMERQRIAEDAAFRTERAKARRVANTPWNTPRADASEHKRDLADRSARRLVS